MDPGKLPIPESRILLSPHGRLLQIFNSLSLIAPHIDMYLISNYGRIIHFIVLLENEIYLSNKISQKSIKILVYMQKLLIPFLYFFVAT